MNASQGERPSDDERALREQARRAWTEDRAQLVFTHPHLATLAMHLEIVPVIDARLPTAATDGVSIFVNPYWLRGCDADTRRFVLAHEVWHNALLHFGRRADRHAVRWNVATDHEVNALLRRAGMTPPEDAVYFAHWDGASAEEVYEQLVSSDSAGSPEGVRGAGADVHLDDVGEPPPIEAMEPPDRRFGPIVGRRDSSFSPRRAPGADELWRDRLVTDWSRMRDVLPGSVRELIDAVARPRLAWQAILRDFVTRASGGRFRWAPPSRRHAHRGVFLPSRRTDALSLAIAVDTSGSTTDAWPAFVGEIDQILHAFGRYEVRLLQCDATIHSDDRYDDARPMPARLGFAGGGGTDFRPVFTRLAVEPPVALVYLTDGFGVAPVESPAYPVLWGLTEDGVAPAGWGSALRLDEADPPRRDRHRPL